MVDVLSFTTTLSVALDRGAEVLPLPWQHESAAAFAREQRATLALGRRAAVAGRRGEPLPRKHPGGTGARTSGAPLSQRVGHQPPARDHRLHGRRRMPAQRRRGGRAGSPSSAPRRSPSSPPVNGGPTGHCVPRSRTCSGRERCSTGCADDVELTPDAQAARAAFRDARADLLDRLLGCPSGRSWSQAVSGETSRSPPSSTRAPWCRCWRRASSDPVDRGTSYESWPRGNDSYDVVRSGRQARAVDRLSPGSARTAALPRARRRPRSGDGRSPAPPRAVRRSADPSSSSPSAARSPDHRSRSAAA